MTKENTQAAGQGGHENAVASKARPGFGRQLDKTGRPGSDGPSAGEASAAELRTESALDKSDEELRRLAVARLAEHLDVGSSLVLRCEELAMSKHGDRLGPIYAAARLMRANAKIAEALANVAQVERRRRSIIERIQMANPKKAELNCDLEDEKNDTSLFELERRIDALARAANTDSALDDSEGANDE
jgi:hypothetical protein